MASRLSGLDGVFLGSHAVSEGMLTARQLKERSYRRLLDGVYALPELQLDHRLYCRAASLLLPEGAVIAGRSAGCWHGGPWPGPGEPVTVLVPRNQKWQGPKGIRVHRTVLANCDWELIDEIPLTTAARTAWDIAALEPVATAVGTIDAMVRSGSLTLSQLQGMVLAGSGRWRVTRVRRVAEVIDPRSESPPESWLRVAFVHADLQGFVPQYEVWAGGQFIARVDLAWPASKVAVEYEGAYHFEGLQIVRDDERLGRLVAAGWLVIRVSAADLSDTDAVVERVRTAVEHRGAS